MIYLDKDHCGHVVAHLRGEYPNEGCGLLSGRDGKILRVHPVTNTEASPVSFLMDSREEFAVFREMRREGLDLLGIYHSHPSSPAYPSEKDRSLAFFENAFYLIVSFQDAERPDLRVFWIREGKIEEDKIRRAE